MKYKERFLEKRRAYYQTHKIQIAAYYREKHRTDIHYRLARNLRNRLNMALKRSSRSGSAVRDLGCTIVELKFYLEGKFQDRMTWENWGMNGWVIDHEVPLSFFDLTNREQFLKACHYSNLQPMWVKENVSKGAKLTV